MKMFSILFLQMDSKNKKQVLVIKNNQHFGVFGGDFNPLTFTLALNGEGTL